MRLFGSSGVRGLANVDLTAVLAEEVGLAVATLAKAKVVLVARDTRVSGEMLEDALVAGLESGGVNVKILGITPTPVLAFLTKRMRADAGLMITASHNPPEYNGIKVFNAAGLPYDEETQIRIESIIANKRFRRAAWRDVGHAQPSSESRYYSEELEKKVTLRRNWHVIVDAGCGATFGLAPAVLKGLGCKVTALNAQPDGWFPSGSPEPNARSVTPLSRVVNARSADAGLAYDGDGDRVAFIDEKGNFVDFDQVMAAYAAHVVKKSGRGTVVTNIEASMSLEKMVEQHGGKVARTRVGDVYISDTLMKRNAVFGGEPCGAWIHPKFHYCPDGILSSALLLEALEDENKSLGEFVAETPKYPVLRRNFRCRNEVKEKVMEQAEEGLKFVFQAYREFSTIDGIRLVLENGWLLVRASGTEPVIRVTVEGESLNAARKILEKGTRYVRKLLGNDEL